MINVSEWEIFIDDVEGELAMDKREGYGGRMIEVVAKEEIMPHLSALTAERDGLKGEVEEARSFMDMYQSKIAALEKDRAEFLDRSIRLAEEGMRLENKIAALEKKIKSQDMSYLALSNNSAALITLKDRQIAVARADLRSRCTCWLAPPGEMCEPCTMLGIITALETAGTEGGAE